MTAKSKPLIGKMFLNQILHLNFNDLQRFLKTDRIPKKVKVLLSGNTHFLNRKGLAIIQHLLRWCGFGVCQYTVTRPALHLQYSSQLQNPGLSLLFKLTCFLCCLPFLNLLAETPDPTLAECFTAQQLKLPHHTVEKVFLANDNQANFTSFQGVTDIEVVDGCLRFKLTGKRAVLGWGNYQAKQAVSDIVGLWEQRNDVEFRLRQSGSDTTWSMIPWADGQRMFRPQALPAMLKRTLKGTNWNNLTFYDRAVRVPVPDGYEFIINGQRGDTIEIEQLRIFQPLEQGVCRYEFELPSDKIWRAVAMVAAGTPDGVHYPNARRRSLLFLNGKEVPRHGPVYYQHAAALDLTPYLQPGNNCIGFEYYGIPPNGATVYLQMKVVFDSGETLYLQTDGTWKVHDGLPSTSAWKQPGYDDTAWELAETQKYSFRKRSYFDQSVLLPEHDGLLVISHPLGKQLYYTDQEDVLLDIAIPPGLATREPTVLCELGRAGNDGLSTPFGNSMLTNWIADSDSLTSQISLGRLDGGVYTVALTLKCGAEIIEQRPREPLVVIRKLNQKIVQGTNYLDGLDLELEDAIDFTAINNERPCLEWQAHYGKNNTEIEQPNIICEAGVHYREGAANAGSGFSYRLNPFKHVGDFYLMELEYPDDAERDFVAVIASKFGGGADAQTGVGAGTGGKYKLTRRMQKLHWIHVADSGVHSIDIVNCASSIARPAAAGSLKIYHIKGDLPSIAVSTNRIFGTLNERTAYSSGHGLNFGVDTPRTAASENEKDESWSPLRRFVQDLVWMYNTTDKYTQYLKFAGQNTHMIGVWQYNRLNSGLVRDYDLPTSRIVPCFKRAMARTFDVNGIKFGASVQLMRFNDIATFANDAQVAQGVADSVWVMDSKGRQYRTGTGARHECINWMHPLVQKRFFELAEELTLIFDMPNFTGLHFLIGTPDLLYPYRGSRTFTEALNIYDDHSFAAFERDTNTRLPFDNVGPERFAQRAAYLSIPENKAAYRSWRCQAAFNFIDGARRILQKQRPELGVMCAVSGINNPTLEYWESTGESFSEFMRGFSIDPDLFARAPYIWLGQMLQSWTLYGHSYSGGTGHRNAYAWRKALEPDIYNAFNRTDERYAFVSINQAEISIAAPGHTAKGTSGGPLVRDDWVLERYKIRANGQPSGASAREVFMQALLTSEPDRLVYGFSDVNLPIGHEQELREFGRVFAALPTARFQPLPDTDIDSNLVLRGLQKDGKSYFYLANPTPLYQRATLTAIAAVPVRPLVEPCSIQVKVDDNSRQIIQLDMPPFALEAGWADTPTLEIVDCKTELNTSEEINYFDDILSGIRIFMADRNMCAALTPDESRLFKQQLTSLESALNEKAYGRAYALLTQYQFWQTYWEKLHNRNLIQKTSDFLIHGWQISGEISTENTVNNAAYIGLEADAGWQPLKSDAPSSGRMGVHSVYPPGYGDGIVYLANRVQVHLPGRYIFMLSHDGGARLFVNGEAVACAPNTRFPIVQDRTRAELDLSTGEHEIVVAFNLDKGSTSGIRFRFAKPDGEEIRVADFPVAILDEE